IRKACQLGDEALSFVLKKVKHGVTEKELAIAIELFLKEEGHDISFAPIVAFGNNAATPHHSPSERKLRNNEFVLFDVGTKVDGYCSDMTRTFFFGKPTERQRKIYQAVLDAQLQAIAYV